jgi:sarcosine oxidase
MTIQADVIVVGLGAMGAATLYQLAARGQRVIGIDRFAPPHEQGSSHGETRITRLAVGEGASYLPLVRRSHEIWRELERRCGATLMQTTGGLIMGPRDGGPVHHGQDAFVQRTIALAEQGGIRHEVLSPDAVMERFPQFRVRGGAIGYYEPDAGMLFPEACVRAQIDGARALGAVVRLDEAVLGIEQTGAGVVVRTARAGVTMRTAPDTLRAARCVVAAGAWIGKLLGRDLPRLARPFRQTLHWFAPERPAEFAPSRFPVFIWMHGSGPEEYFYGFPASEADGGVKVAAEQYTTEADPDAMVRRVGAAESEAMYRDHVAARLPGLSSRVLRAKTCLYTVTPDAGFIVDAVPGADRILVVSACSGHGFKHSAALGEAIAERLAHGNSMIPLDAFALGRLAPVSAE